MKDSYAFNFDFAYITKIDDGYDITIEKDSMVIISLHFISLDSVAEFCCLNGGFIHCDKEVEKYILSKYNSYCTHESVSI